MVSRIDRIRIESTVVTRARNAGARLSVTAVAVLLLATPATAVDLAGELGASRGEHVARTMDANGRVAAACPGRIPHTDDIALAGRADRNATLSAALKVNPGMDTSSQDPLDPSSYRFADDPEKVAEVMRTVYGPDSFITRSAETVRAIANAAGRGSQAPIHGLGKIADAVVDSGQITNPFHDMTLSPAVRIGEAGLNLRSRW